MKVADTGVHEETLTHIGKRFSQGPPNAPDFKIHRAMERILKTRGEMVGKRECDWAIAEAFAFGSLLEFHRAFLEDGVMDSLCDKYTFKGFIGDQVR